MKAVMEKQRDTFRGEDVVWKTETKDAHERRKGRCVYEATGLSGTKFKSLLSDLFSFSFFDSLTSNYLFIPLIVYQ